MTYSTLRSCLGLVCALCALTHCEGDLSTTKEVASKERDVAPAQPGGPVVKTDEPLVDPGNPPADACATLTEEITSAPLRRLSRDEYSNTLALHFSEEAMQKVRLRLSALQGDHQLLATSPGTFERALVNKNEQQKLLQRYDIARLLAEHAAISPSSLLHSVPSCMQQTAELSESCMREFVTRFGERLLRRPLDTQEIDFFMAPWTRESVELDGSTARFEVILQSLLTDPEFLLLVPHTAPEDATRLDMFALASRLSYATRGAAPDEALLEAALKGELEDESVRMMHARRLLDTPEGHRHVKQMFSRWFGLERTVNLEPAGVQVGVDVNDLYDEMKAETYAFIEHVVFDRKGSYTDLLTSDLDFPGTDTLAHLMGHERAAPQGIASTTGRAGVLARPALLVHTEPRVAPIHRGVHIMYRFMCRDLKLPDGADLDIDAELAKVNETIADPSALSSRALSEARTSSAACSGCHKLINPLGFALSGFGPLGDSWEQEHVYDATTHELLRTLPVDSAVDFYVDGEFRPTLDARDYAEAIAASNEGRACAALQLFRITHMREPVSRDLCHMKRLRDAIDVEQPVFEILARNAAQESLRIKEVSR